MAVLPRRARRRGGLERRHGSAAAAARPETATALAALRRRGALVTIASAAGADAIGAELAATGFGPHIGRAWTGVADKVVRLSEDRALRRRGDLRRRHRVRRPRRVTDAINSARHRQNSMLFSDCSAHDLLQFERLVCRYAACI